MLGGPILGYYFIHCLEGCNTGAAPFTVAVRVYSEILFLFSAMVLIFALDFCGMQNVVDFLVQWILAVMLLQILTGSPVYLVLNVIDLLLKKELCYRISKYLLDYLNTFDL